MIKYNILVNAVLFFRFLDPNSSQFFVLTHPDLCLAQNFAKSLGGIADKTPKILHWLIGLIQKDPLIF